MSTRRYAEGTQVAAERTRGEIERTLSRFGATAFAYGWDDGPPARAVIQFKARDRHLRMELPVPDRSDFAYTDTGRLRTESAMEQAYDQETRRRWRALLLIVKAKLEAVSSGIVTFEDEWLAHTVMPDGRTVAQHVQPAITSAYEHGAVPQLLPGYHHAELEP